MDNPRGLCQFKFFLYNGECYFYGWNNWSLAGGFIFLYDDIMSEISSDARFKRNTLYSVILFVERHAEDPEIVFEWDFAGEKVTKNQYREVKRIANEVRQIEEEDSELLGEQLDELAVKLKKTNK